MTNQELEDLNTIYFLNNEIESLDMELSRIHDLNFYKSNKMSDMPRGSRKVDKITEYVQKVCDLEDMLNYTANDLLIRRKRVESLIQKAPSAKVRAIVRFRCCNNKSWYWISDKLSMDRRAVKQIYDDFISSLK